jgi:hypothetical protein
MHKYALSFVFLVSTLLFADTAVAQMDDEPPPPPPLGDVDEPPPPPSRSHGARRSKSRRGKKAATDDASPVVRASGEEGNMGLFFRFGGLATMTATGDNQGANDGVMNAQLGLKFVMSEKIMVPLFFGMGIVHKKVTDQDGTTGFSMDFGAGVEYHFRIWRRLSPFFGAILKLGFYDKTSDSDAEDLSIRFHVGPTIGMEYYIADRVSLAVAYMLMITLYADTVNADSTTINFDMSTKSGLDVAAAAESGGYMTLCFYF